MQLIRVIQFSYICNWKEGRVFSGFWRKSNAFKMHSLKFNGDNFIQQMKTDITVWLKNWYKLTIKKLITYILFFVSEYSGNRFSNGKLIWLKKLDPRKYETISKKCVETMCLHWTRRAHCIYLLYYSPARTITIFIR